MGRRGGIKSGETRRKKSSMKAAAKWILELAAGNVTLPDGTRIEISNAEAIVLEQTKKAKAGDVESAKFVAKINGELTEKAEVAMMDVTADKKAFESVFGKIVPDCGEQD